MADDDARYLRGRRMTIEPDAPTVKLVDLFSGCGGLSLGLEEAARQLGRSLDVRLMAELDAMASSTYGANLAVEAKRRASDVTKLFDRKPGSALSAAERETVSLVGGDLDTLVGGPPCQGHSTLNNHTRGDDPKNALYLTMVRAAEVLRPRSLIIENVPAVERDRLGVVERARSLLGRLGYEVVDRVVSMVEIGVPQQRRRHVLIGRRGGAPDLDAALASSSVGTRDLRWAIGDLVGVRESSFDDAALLTRDNERRAKHLLRHDLYDLPNRLRPPCQRDEHRYKSMYGRLRWDQPAQTITTGFGSPGQGRYLHPSALRTLTPHEAARLQFFPDWFDFTPMTQRRALARVIGNAVPPKLSFVLGRHLLAEGVTRREKSPVEKKGAGRRPAIRAAAPSLWLFDP